MRSRSLRPIALLLSFFLSANVPIQAAPITIRDVMQMVGNFQNPPDLRLRNFSQTPSTQTPNATPKVTADVIDPSVVVIKNDSLLAGVVIETHRTQDPINIVVPGDIQGTVCDCGEVTVAAGWPKWPLLFLAAIPLFFIDSDDCDDCDKVVPSPTPTPNSTPTPTPPPVTPVPEPGSLLLLGSGLAALGAGVRRRRVKAKLKGQRDTTEEG